jgi:hypothetical protein
LKSKQEAKRTNDRSGSDLRGFVPADRFKQREVTNMKDIKHLLIPITASTLSLFVAAGAAADSQSTTKATDVAASGGAHSSPVEQLRSDSQRQGDTAIDKDAVAAIDEAQKAVTAIGEGRNDQALAAIERATGKINVLTARKPSAALIPVKSEVAIIDLASKDPVVVDAISSAARSALSSADYPKARTLLDQLTSEIHVKTYNLPLATYPAAMQTAARLLDEKKADEARQTLVTALNTLIVTDQAIPLPLVEAQAAIKDAQAKRDQDKPSARKLLANARQDLDRARELGYANKDPEYASLNQSIADLDKQLGGTESTSSAFASLREKMSSFFERVTGKEPPPPERAKN